MKDKDDIISLRKLTAATGSRQSVTTGMDALVLFQQQFLDGFHVLDADRTVDMPACVLVIESTIDNVISFHSMLVFASEDVL